MSEIIKLADVKPDKDRYPYVCGDTETTGVDDYAEVIEVTMIEHDEYGNTGAMISYLCEPLSGEIPEGASKVNGIYMKDVKGYPSFMTGGVREDVIEFIKGRTFVAHNAPFDLRMMKLRVNNTFDTLKWARNKWGRGGNKLKQLILKIGLEWDDELAHRAEYDVRKTIEFFTWIKHPELIDKLKENKRFETLKMQTDLFD